jgi:hypothetical protein
MISRSIFSHIKYIPLALEKNVLLGHSTPVNPSTESNPHWSRLPTGSPCWHRQRKEDLHLHIGDRHAKLQTN